MGNVAAPRPRWSVSRHILSPMTLARRLSPADGQLVEIARAISEDSRVLVMDEPTTSLSPPEIDRLFGVVKRTEGQRARHRLRLALARRSVPHRRPCHRAPRRPAGRQRPADRLDQDDVIRMMVGREVRETVAETRADRRRRLRCQGSDPSRRARPTSPSMSAPARSSDLSGLVGAGRSELAACIFGIDPYDSGSVSRRGHEDTGRTTRRRRSRPASGSCPKTAVARRWSALLSVRTNITLSMLDRISPRGLLSFAQEREIADARGARRWRSRRPRPRSGVSTLSGGNQQKVVLVALARAAAARC